MERKEVYLILKTSHRVIVLYLLAEEIPLYNNTTNLYILSDMVLFTTRHTNLYHLHYHDEVHIIPLGRWDCWVVNVRDWLKHSTDFDGDFHASREAVPEISAAHDVIVHVPHHDPLLFSATERMWYTNIPIYLTHY